MMRSKLRVLVFVVLVGGAGWPFLFRGTPIVNAPPRPGAIVAFGDSLTAGMGADVEQAYPEQLARLIQRPVINCGVSGDTIADAAARLDRDVLAQHPTIVIVLLGGNDLLRQLDLDNSFRQLEQMVRAIQGEGAMVVLVGLGSFTPVVNLNGRYKQLAQRTGALFAPNILRGIFGQRALMSDTIHPNAQGYKIMAERIAKAIEPHLPAA